MKDHLALVSPAEPSSIVLRFPARAEYVRLARLTAAGVASGMSFTFEEIEDIKLAVVEACNNAVLHAQPASSAKARRDTVEVRFTPHDGHLEIVVCDEGRLPSVASLSKPSRPNKPPAAGEPPESGFGLLLIETLMDEVEHFAGPSQPTSVRMIKRMTSCPAPAWLDSAPLAAPHGAAVVAPPATR